MRTNVVLDPKLVARAMKKAGVRTMRETIDIALREYVSKPDYDVLLGLAGNDIIAPGYDPKAGDASLPRLGEDPPAYAAGRRRGRQKSP
jgi:hypothetical protein